MLWRVEVKEKKGMFDPLGAGIRRDIMDLGLNGVGEVAVVQVYTIDGEIDEAQIRLISEELLTDQVTQDFVYTRGEFYTPPLNGRGKRIVEIAYNKGVMDPVEESTIKGIRDLGIETVSSVRTARQYDLKGDISDSQMNLIIEKVLANKLIQHVVRNGDFTGQISKPAPARTQFDVIQVGLLNADDKTLLGFSRKGQLFLNLDEMRAIQAYFRKVGRNPMDCELETIAQTWSEHCHHKTFRGNIRYQETEKGKTKTKFIRNLLKSTIIKATTEINKPWCVSVFHDNAGVIRFDKDFNVCFKVETHNHPSALEPFGGANTGVGGVIRDTLGTGLGAKPVCNTDVFCFAPPEYAFEDLPPGTLHPKRVMKGVVSGVRDYGNKMGIPTVNGAIVFDEGFVGNPLVFCGNVGLIPKGKEKKKVNKGDRIVAVGGRTGRDGIHGATFSSGELTTESEVISSGAVQIGHPIQEKKVLDGLLKARDENLYSAVTDCGAGGFSSAVGEMGAELGARVDLEKAPLKYAGLSYTEIWISESQERMVLSVPPNNVERLLSVFAAENVEATVIGEFTGTRRLELFYEGCQVCDLDMDFLHEGIPNITKDARWTPPIVRQVQMPVEENLTESLLDVLSHYNVASKEWVIRQYDHEVQGTSVIKPLVGVTCDGPSDAAVLTPRLGSKQGIAVANGINVRYGMIDPYWMAASCIDEAIRQIIAVSGDLDQIALLDNFCWGNPDKPDRLGGLVRAALACYKTAVGFGTPFISGKDSLYNEYTEGKKSIAIPGTILISAIGILDDVSKCITMDLKRAGNFLYIVGETSDELGGSIYFHTSGQLGPTVPKVNIKAAVKTYRSLSSAIQKGIVAAAHDCSEGGLAVTLAEMAFSGCLGFTVMLKYLPYKGKAKRSDYILFSESNSRFVVEVDPDHQKTFEKIMDDVPFALIGRVEDSAECIVYGLKDEVCLNTYHYELKEAWQRPLRW